MPFVVVPCAPGAPPLSVEAEEHRVEGAFHVFRRTTSVMGHPRTVVVLRLAVSTVREVRAPTDVRTSRR